MTAISDNLRKQIISKKNRFIIQLLLPFVLIAFFYLVFPKGFELATSIKIALAYIIINLSFILMRLDILYMFKTIYLTKYRENKLAQYERDRNRFLSYRKYIKVLILVIITIVSFITCVILIDSLTKSLSEKTNHIYLILLIIPSVWHLKNELFDTIDTMINELNERLKKDGGEEVNLS